MNPFRNIDGMRFALSCASVAAQRLSRDEQTAIAYGVFRPVNVGQMEKMEGFAFCDTLDGRRKVWTRSHIADSFHDAVVTWSDSMQAFCSGGDTRGLTLMPLRIDCSAFLLFDRIQGRRRMRFISGGRTTVYYDVAHGQ